MKTVNENDWLKQSPYDRFMYFIAPKVDRYKTLLATVEKLGLNSMVIAVEGNKHIFIFPPGLKFKRPEGSVFPFMGQDPYMFVAHYDRVDGSPGANDNSIAVFHLLRAAITLPQLGLNKWIIVFTDKEELSSGENFDVQGSFSLAQKLKSWGLEKVKIFNFDACGTGDTFVFSTITDIVLGNNESPNVLKLKQEITGLRKKVFEAAHNLRFDKFLAAPTPFCDDMGFLRAGLAAQTVTMLPSDEASQYEEILRKNPDFPKLIISGEIKKPNMRKHLPATWRNMNTPADNIQRLTPQYFDQVLKFIQELCQ